MQIKDSDQEAPPHDSHLQYVSELTFLRFVASLGKNRDSWKSNDSGSRLHSEVAKSEM